jgi:hypothetical protein
VKGVGKMRRTILVVCVFALAFAGLGGSAVAGPKIDFGIGCDDPSILASGVVAGWMGMLKVEDAEGVVEPSVAVLYSFKQDTWVNRMPSDGDPDYQGERVVAGNRQGTVFGCYVFLEWDSGEDHFYAEIYEAEIRFRLTS